MILWITLCKGNINCALNRIAFLNHKVQLFLGRQISFKGVLLGDKYIDDNKRHTLDSIIHRKNTQKHVKTN